MRKFVYLSLNATINARWSPMRTSLDKRGRSKDQGGGNQSTEDR